MKTAGVVLLCLLAATLFTAVLCTNERNPEHCCFDHYPRRIHKKYITKYFITDSRCTKPSIILITAKFKEICASPNATWVQGIMESLDDESF